MPTNDGSARTAECSVQRARRKAYDKPALVVYGDLRRLVTNVGPYAPPQGKGGSRGDGGTAKSRL